MTNQAPSCSSFHRRRECCISHVFSETASANADKPALIHASHLSFSFSRLLVAVRSLASRLRFSFPPSNIVGIYAPPSADYVVAALAALRLGLAFLPLDHSWPKQRILSAIASSGAGLVLATKSGFGLDSTSDWIATAGDFHVLWFSTEEESAGGDASEDFDWPCESDEERRFSYVMYTSGSTGKPKGVCGTEQGLMNRFLWMQELYPLGADDVLLFKTPVSFVDHLQEFLSAVLTGCTLVIPPFNELKRNLFSIVNFIQDYSITRLTAVPSLVRAILPCLETQRETNALSLLKLLVLSGEVFTLSLFHRISRTLPGTSILNLYGSTEVSGDCTYFDCKRLGLILDSETLASVPIGVPIGNCDVVLVGGNDDLPNHGEICVSGVCNSAGYLHDSKFIPLDCEKLPKSCVASGSSDKRWKKVYFRTGDYARRLQSGNLVFVGRKDRTIKVNGQRVSFDEIEDVLSEHPYVVSSAVISHKFQTEGVISLVAFVILEKEKRNEICTSHIKSWMAEKLSSAMLPNNFLLREAIPTTSSGKVDYELLLFEFLQRHVEEDNLDVANTQLLQFIKKAFCDALTIEEVSDDDDFFLMGGNSIAAAHVSHKLGVDMRLIYKFPTPSKLCTTLRGSKLMKDAYPYSENIANRLQLSRTHSGVSTISVVSAKRLKLDSELNDTEEGLSLLNESPWFTTFEFLICSLSRCNKVIYGGDDRLKHGFHEKCAELPINSTVSLQQVWRADMGSCVDASPLILFKGSEAYLFIGSHSHEFMCINAESGYVQWKMQLEGRIECSAAILADSSQVIVGCYEGKLYFIDTLVGEVCWTFQTSGEVKSQPVADSKRQLIWCGSHDHHLYALDYIRHCCVYKVDCAGSIFGSPVINEVNDILYVASTSGRITAISIKDSTFEIMWLHELGTPVFGSLVLSPQTENIICCLVDGHVVSLDLNGSVMWKHRTSGPIFAGACISPALPSQVLICSRNGSIYSFQVENGKMLWEYNVGDPITSSAYVDEHLCSESDLSTVSSNRLVCVCSSSGRVVLLQISSDVTKELKVTEVARKELKGDVFSSPVMVGGRIFVGCRDNFVHCLAINMLKKTLQLA